MVDSLFIINSRLSELNLFVSRNITVRGCQSLAAMLKDPNSNLETLNIEALNVEGNMFGDEGAHIFANALTSNCKLTTL